MSSSHGFWSLGGFLGGGLGGFVIAATGARNPCACWPPAAALVVMLAAMPFLIGEPRQPAPAKGEKRASSWPRGWPIYILGMMALFCMVPEGGVLDWAALYLTREHGSTLATASLAFALFAGTMAVVRFWATRCATASARCATLRVSGLIGAAGMVGAGRAPTDWLAIACFALLGPRHRQHGADRAVRRRKPPRRQLGLRHRHRHDDGLFRHPDRALGHRLCRRACGLPR